mgnify:CR=1 FL=1
MATFYTQIRDASGGVIIEDFETDLDLDVDTSQVVYGSDPDVTVKTIWLGNSNMETGCELLRLIAKQVREAAEAEIAKHGVLYSDAVDDEDSGDFYMSGGRKRCPDEWRENQLDAQEASAPSRL